MKRGRLGVSGALAGAVNGLFGGGGGMVLAPLLESWCRVEEKRALANCVATILPCCVLSGGVYLVRTGLDWGMAWPYLAGGLAGGFVGGEALYQGARRVAAASVCGVSGIRRGAVSAVKDIVLPLLAGMGCGVLSAWGVGGGTLLLLVMTLFFGVDQAAAQGVNLLYFLPTAAMGLIWHRQNGLLDKALLRRTVPWALVTAAAASWAATALDVTLLRRPFGIFLLIAAAVTLRRK